MAPRRKKRRMRVTMRTSHARYRWKVFFGLSFVWMRRLFFMGLAIWGSMMIYAVWQSAEFFRVRDVVIAPQAPAELSDFISVSAGDHLFGFSTRVAALKLEKEFPELADVKVQRRFDRTLYVSVKKRAPVVRVPHEDEWYGMDMSGHVFPLRTASVPLEKLPVLAGAPAGKQAVVFLEFLGKIREQKEPWAGRAAKMRVTGGRDVAIYLDDNTAVFWGEALPDIRKIKKKSARLQRVMDDESLAGGVDYFRFVDDGRIAIKLKKKSAEENESAAPKPDSKNGRGTAR